MIEFFRRRLGGWLFRPGKRDELESRLGYRFRDRALLAHALRHRSHAHSANAGRFASNERLEFLGDSVLGMVAAEYLFERYPALGEGDLTQLRAALVRRETLAQAALEINLGDWLRLSHAEERRGGRERPSILADAFEAVLGAAFIDGGIVACSGILRSCLLHRAAEFERTRAYVNPKNELQEKIQEAGMHEPPNYQIVEASGPAHDRTFVVEVLLDGESMGQGTGASKRDAEVSSARDALRRIERESRMINGLLLCGDGQRAEPPQSNENQRESDGSPEDSSESDAERNV